MVVLRKKLLVIGVVILAVVGSAVSMNTSKKAFQHNGDIAKVEKITLHSDISNVELAVTETNLSFEYTGEKSFLGEPEIEIDYHSGHAFIRIKAIPKNWMKMLPAARKTGTLRLHIPSKILEEVHITTGQGNIDVESMDSINRLTLSSNVGNVKIDSFTGESLDIKLKNGSINLGEINSEITIKNQTGNLNSLTFATLKGENSINLSNGDLKVTLPTEVMQLDVGLNIYTKNGKINTMNESLSEIMKVKRNAGQKMIKNSDAKNQLNIAVLVGNIEID